jgi:PTS system D-glucosamine-specific IIA component/PTS system glucose-specific IIA component
MFNFLKKKHKNDLKLYAPADGKVIELSKVPDPVFAQKMAGEGVAIDVTGDTIVAPTDGTITLIFKTNHAFAMSLDNGIELLVHIGLDTVTLDEEAFKKLAEENIFVKAGTPIIKINRKFILEKGVSLITPVLITNPEKVSEFVTNSIDNDVSAGKDEIIICKF